MGRNVFAIVILLIALVVAGELAGEGRHQSDSRKHQREDRYDERRGHRGGRHHDDGHNRDHNDKHDDDDHDRDHNDKHNKNHSRNHNRRNGHHGDRDHENSRHHDRNYKNGSQNRRGRNGRHSEGRNARDGHRRHLNAPSWRKMEDRFGFRSRDNSYSKLLKNILGDLRYDWDHHEHVRPHNRDDNNNNESGKKQYTTQQVGQNYKGTTVGQNYKGTTVGQTYLAPTPMPTSQNQTDDFGNDTSSGMNSTDGVFNPDDSATLTENIESPQVISENPPTIMPDPLPMPTPKAVHYGGDRAPTPTRPRVGSGYKGGNNNSPTPTPTPIYTEGSNDTPLDNGSGVVIPTQDEGTDPEHQASNGDSDSESPNEDMIPDHSFDVPEGFPDIPNRPQNATEEIHRINSETASSDNTEQSWVLGVAIGVPLAVACLIALIVGFTIYKRRKSLIEVEVDEPATGFVSHT